MSFVKVKIEEAFIVKDGTHDSPKYIDKAEGYPLVTSKNLKTGKIDLHDVDYISKEDYEKINLRSKVDNGDLLFAMIGTIGNPVVVATEPTFAIKNVALFKKNNDGNSVEYLRFILSSEQLKRKLRKDSKGGTQQFVSLGYLRKLEIPLPCVEDQIHIANILRKAEALINQRKESLLLLDEFLKSTFLATFGTAHKSWPTKPLEAVTAPGRIITYGIVQAGPHVDGGVPYIKTGDIKNGKIDVQSLSRTSVEIAKTYKRSEVNKGDIVMSIRATVGTVALLPDELDGANLTQGTARISPGPEVNRTYLYCLLQTEHIQRWINRQVKGSTFREITLSKLRELPVTIPPMELQKDFALIFKKTQELKERYTTSLHELKNLYASLSQRAFKGELTLK